MNASQTKKGLIVAAGSPVPEELLQRAAAQSDVVAAVDGGYLHCRRAGVRPDLLLGDMDSLADAPGLAREARLEGVRVELLPCEKDDTDTLFACRRLIRLGCGDITLVCALGGRLDHLVANLQTLVFLLKNGARGRILDENCCAEAMAPGVYTAAREDYDYFSLFPLGGCCRGVTIENARYPLEGYTLENSFPIGVSNAFLEGDARVRFLGGELLLIRCREDRTGARGAS